MAKSLFSNNNTDITDKYRARNEETLRKERAQNIDKRIEEFSHAQGGEDWANAVIAFQQTLNEQNVEVVNLLINLPLYSQLKKDARNELDKIELLKRNARIEAEAAQKAKEQAEADEIDGEIISLSKAKRNESWIADVERLYDVVKNYDPKKQFRPKENGLISNLLNETKLVRDALGENEQAERFAKSKATSARWANEIIAYDKTVDDAIKQYLPCIDGFNKALKRARDILFAEAEKEQEELDAIESSIDALYKAARDESWVNDVYKFKNVVLKLSDEKKRAVKNLALYDKMCAEAELVKAAALVNADMLKLIKTDVKNESWAKKVIEFDKNADKKLLPYVACLSQFNDAKTKADEIIKVENEKKAQAKKLAAQKAAEKRRLEAAKEKEKLAQKAIDTDLIRKKLKNIKNGQTITFGSYAPHGSNEKMPIEWIVVGKGEQAVLVSKYVLECGKVVNYDLLAFLADGRRTDSDKHESFNWRNSAVRTWLNDVFYSEAFSDAEKDFIVTETNQSYYTPTPDGINFESQKITTEKVYIPSMQELSWSKILKKHAKAKCVKGINRKEIVTKKGLFNRGNAVYLTRDVFTRTYSGGMTYCVQVVLPSGKNGTCWLITNKGQKGFYHEGFDNIKRVVDHCGIRPMITINYKY